MAEPRDSPERRESLEIDSIETNSMDSDPSPHEDVEQVTSDRAFRRLASRRSSYFGMEEADRMELRRIATVMSHQKSTATVPTAEGISYHDDPTINPASESFDVEKWVKRISAQLEKEGITPKKTSVAFQNLSVSGTGDAVQFQQTVSSFLAAPLHIGKLFSFGKKTPKTILHSFDGLLDSGELLIVLGRPGSGCSTLLKTLTGELQGLSVDKKSTLHYKGIPQAQMIKEFKGETTYNQEVDKHFPHLTVGETLTFAAAVRAPSKRILGMSRKDYQKHAAQIAMAICGLSHTYNTKVGNDFVRGVSGGERKRVSIAEMILAGSPLGAWDNSTRGLDSATALKFVESLRLSSDFAESANAVAIYQASQAIYDLFDKATVLYEGRQIYFGPASKAKAYFEKMGWACPQRQTTGDFLTSITNPQERQPISGMENQVPRTPEDFEKYWRNSPEFANLNKEIDEYTKEYPIDPHGKTLAEMREQKNIRQAKHVRPKSPYTISLGMQIGLTTKRAYQRIWNDVSATLTGAIIHVVMALIIGSVFYGTPNTTAGFYSRGSVLFQAILLNALTAISEITNQYSQRPIVEKHNSYAFYHPATEAIAGVVSDIPVKFVSGTCFNIVLYFLAGLRREPGPFFLYFLITYISTFVMSAIFRTLAAVTKIVSQAMMLAGVIVLSMVIYTGFVIRVPQMHPWFGWIRWINPIFYAFEILVANEFHGREFPCSQLVPPYQPPIGDSFICGTLGAVAGQTTVSGSAFIAAEYNYYYSHVWRNFGILIAFLIFFMLVYFTAVELNSATESTAEVLVFQRKNAPAHLLQANNRSAVNEDLAQSGDSKTESAPEVKGVEKVTNTFSWKNVVYDIEIKGEPRRLLNHVSGWVKPGTLTALMGVSGAGKTTLLDTLAQRTTMGIVTGGMFVNNQPLDTSFPRKIGYVQQQDLHLATSTVRESLRFSAILRQPKSVSKKDKYKYVEDVIDMLNMRDFADAVVGVPGEGLNVEQRKLLTIGVELAAKPKLLLFLDEPTSGLDSQSAWAICAFLRRLADSGQAILCTVHQPSAILFQQFDRLLFLAKGGSTVYFGDIGSNSRTLLQYFESNGARKCSDEENPAEYMLEIVNKGKNPDGKSWHDVWVDSPENRAVEHEVDRIQRDSSITSEPHNAHEERENKKEFAMPFFPQLYAVTRRVFQQYWRTPSYVFAKFILAISSGLFIGFSFYGAKSTMAGMQNVLFSVFMLITIFSTIVQQIQPHFLTQRDLYEVRERPSRTYSWRVFMIANVIVEIPFQIVTGVLLFGCTYYAVIGIQSSARQGLVLLFCIQLLIYASSFAQMTIAALPDALTASSLVTLLVIMSITFCGVLQSPTALPGFWIFMYRVSPFTYWIGGMSATQLHGRAVICSEEETSIFNPPPGQTCQSYLAPFLALAPGTLQNPNDTSACRYCIIQNADQFLAESDIYYSQRWRNFGILWAFVFFNTFIAVATYYLFRVVKWDAFKTRRAQKKASQETLVSEQNTEQNKESPAQTTP